ncbi:hypothetical protein OIU35_07015 [Boseaceae bacterium BT-24-1]|nr:hypothetical protein [Boseaceae bacterium BT-24-1]
MGRKPTRDGICKLTKIPGRFVDSHLLPKALTRADGLGPGLIQQGNGRTERRLSSWYDKELVTEEGEAILSKYDNWAIPTLRRHRLVWSGWGPLQTLPDFTPFGDTHVGIRQVDFGDEKNAREFRLFLLSLLWRAAATTRPEFAEVTLSSDDLEQLREMVLDGNPEPLWFYPASLVQLSSLGVRHNHAPMALTKTIPTIGGVQGYQEPCFRFFLDGLIIHFSRMSEEEHKHRNLGPLRVGNERTLTLSTVTYEGSAQAENLAIIQMEAVLGRPLVELGRGPFWPKS